MQPLINDNDPIVLKRDIADALDLGLGNRKRQSKYKPLPTEKQKSIVDEALGIGAGGLQMLGSALDFAGSHVRGGLSGLKTGDFTTPKTGRQLLETYGVVGPNTDQGWLPDTGDLAGFAADIATDPLTYLTLGGSAIGKAGQVAKAVGLPVKGAAKYATLREGLAAANDLGVTRAAARAAKASGTRLRDVADQQLGGLFGAKVPFGPSFVPQIAQGPTAQAIGQLPGKGLGLAMQGIEHVAPPVADLMRKGGNVWTTLTDPAVRGKTAPLEQAAARMATKAQEATHPVALKEYLKHQDTYVDLLDEFHKANGSAFNNDIGKSGEVLRRAIQLAGERRSPNGVFDVVNPGLNVSSDLHKKVGDLGTAITDAQNTLHQALKDRGVNPADMGAYADFMHMFRQTTEHAAEGAAKQGGKLFGTNASGLLKRNAATKFIPAEYVNQIVSDPNLLYQNLATGQMRAPSHIAAILNNDQKYMPIIQSAAAAAGKKPLDVADELANFVASTNGKYFKNGGKYYSDDILKNHLDYTEGLTRALANADATHGFFHANLVPHAGTPAGDAMLLSDAFKAMGWDDTLATSHFLGKYGANAANMMVPKSVVAAAASLADKSTNPTWLDSILKGVDSVTQLYKKSLTIPFPAFHARNRVSGLWSNFASNEIKTPADILDYRKAAAQVRDIINNPAANRDVLNRMVMHRAIPLDYNVHDVDIMSGAAAHPVPENLAFGSLTRGGPLRALAGVPAEAVRQYKEARAAGSGKFAAAAGAVPMALFKNGSKTAQQIEFMNRAEMYLYLENKGWSPAAAAKRTNEIQIDYSNLTKAEKAVMKRVVPFYSYTRKMVPEVLKNLYERPGGIAAQTVRASNAGRSEGDYIPGYIGEGMSVELPSGGYLSEFGLPTDQFSDLFAKGPSAYSTVRRTGQKLAAQMHPLIKAPLEMVTGKNLFTGKDLTDLYQYPTNSVLLNSAVGNSPLSRLVTTARYVGDKRKTWPELGLGLTTGARVSHPTGGKEREKQYAAKSILDEILRENPSIGSVTDLYVKQGGTLTPRDEELYRAYRGIVQQQTKAKKKAKKAAAK